MSQPTVLFDAPGPRTRRTYRIGNVLALVLLAGLLAWLAVAMARQGQLTAAKWEPFATTDLWRWYILPGLQATVTAAAISIVTALAFGFVFGIGRMSRITPVRWVCGAVVEFFRAVPVLLMMVFSYQAYMVFAAVPPAQLSLAAVVTGLTVYNGSIVAELLRSGVHSLPSGQSEAAQAVGLRPGQVLRSVLLPQGVVAMLPALVGQLVVILKDTALGYWVTYPELLRAAERIGAGYQNVIPALIVVACLFIVINLLLSRLAENLAGRLRSRTAAVVRTRAPGTAGARSPVLQEGGAAVSGPR